MPVVVARLARNPVAVAWLPVLLLPPLLLLDAALTEEGPDVTALGVLAAFAGCAPLALRGRLRFWQLAPLLTAGIVLELWALLPDTTVVLIPMVALADLATRGDRRRSLWMGVAVAPFVAVSIAPFAEDAAELVSLVVGNLALCLLAIAVGDVMRSRQEAVERLVAVREEETLRRLGDERLAIAREVHDVVAHALVAINVQAGVAAHLLDRDPDQAHSALRAIKDASGTALTDLRAALGVLRGVGGADAPEAPVTGLGDLEELAGGPRAAGVAVSLAVDDAAAERASSPVQAAAYRIVQEALTNAMRHGRAGRVDVRVAASGDALTVEVVDDGAGGQTPGGADDGAAGQAPGGTGSGLRGMRERAQALDGTLESGPAPGGGWRVAARLPLAPAETRSPA